MASLKCLACGHDNKVGDQSCTSCSSSLNLRLCSACEAINARTAKERTARAKPLQLKPGEYVFRVTNRNVPYELGFWLRGASTAGRLTLPSVSGGGLLQGKTQDYRIELKPGEYVYSCPLNTTPDYKLIVR